MPADVQPDPVEDAPDPEDRNSSRLRSIAPERESIGKDAVAGLTGSVASVPDGMAAATLAGVNPVLGLYASIVGPVIGGLLSSTVLMRITTTGAAALAAGSVLYEKSDAERAGSLALLVLIAGLFALVLGWLRLAKYTRFVSYSVMTGFLSGVAVLIVLSQASAITGVTVDANSALTEAIGVVANIGRWDPATVVVAGTTIALMVVVAATPLRSFAALLALAVPTAIVAILEPESVALVGSIPGGLPLPVLPDISLLSLDLATGGLAVAVIVVIQGAGVATAAPNPGGSKSRMSRDFIAQGAANVGVGLVQGAPVGGSLSQTALNLQAGARTRWAAIMSGLLLAVILLAFARLVEIVPLACLGGLLLVAGVRTLNLAEVTMVWSTSLSARLVVVTTFVATLFLPIQVAIAIGAVLSALVFLFQASSDATIMELRETPKGVEQRPAPTSLRSNEVTVLEVRGSVFYAGAEALSRGLPRPEGAEDPVVILRMRTVDRVGATWVKVLHDYAQDVAAAGGRLWISGVQPTALSQMEASGRLELAGEAIANVVAASPVIGESTRAALAEGTVWLATARAEAEAADADDAL
jgi:SulP family sulfate permease